MELIKSLYFFLLFCGISNSLGNSIADSGNQKWFSSDVSQDTMSSFTGIEVVREDLLNPRTELRRKRNTVDENCNLSSFSSVGNFASVADATKRLRFVPSMKCNHLDSISNICKRTARLLDCGAFYFQNATRSTMTPHIKVPLVVVEKLFHATKDFAERSNKLVQDLLENQRQCCNVSDFKTRLLEETMNTLLNNTEDYLETAQAKYCGWQISMGNLQDAVLTLRQFRIQNKLSIILEDAYHYHHGENIQKILEFIQKLPCSERESAYVSFADILKTSHHTTSSGILQFWEFFKSQNGSTNPNCTGTLTKEATNNLLKWSFGKDVRSRGRNVPIIYSFLNSNEVAYDGFLTDFIKEAYNGNIKNVQNILEFTKGLPKKDYDLSSCLHLFKEINETTGFNGHEILMVVNRIHILKNDADAAGTDTGTAGSVIEGVPSGIKSLLLEGKVSIKSKLFPNISIGLREKDDTYAMACPAGLYYDFTNAWSVEVLEDGRYFRFTDGYNRSLATSSRSSKLSASEGNSHWRQWQVTPVHNGEYFYLANRATGQIMEAQQFEKRGIFNGCTYVNGVRPTRWQKAQKYWSINNVAETDTLAG